MATKISGSKRATISKKLKSAASQSKRVHVIPQKGNWAVKVEGAQKAYRVVSNKETAISRAKSIVKSGVVSCVVVHRKDGTIAGTIKGGSKVAKAKRSSGKAQSVRK